MSCLRSPINQGRMGTVMKPEELNDEELIQQLKIKIDRWKSWWSSTDGSAGAYYYMEVSPFENEAINRGLIKGWRDLEESK